MKKKLIFYWYIPPFEWHWVYDLHLKNLLYFRDRFDEVEFILSFNINDIELQFVQRTMDKLKAIFPNAKFTVFENNKEARESKYFYNEIVMKMEEFDENQAVFFAHNKGVETYYVPRKDCIDWINSLYYFNLKYKEKIDEYLNNPDVCMIGTGRLINYAPHVFASFLTHKWMYAGTYFWMVPRRVNKYIKEHNIMIPNKPGRYHTEGFPGLIFPVDCNECITIHGDKLGKETWHDYIKRTSSEEEVADFFEK